MDVFIYSKHLRDLSKAVSMCEEAFPHEDFTIICEKTADRCGFEALLERVKNGDVVFISAMQALKDDFYCKSIMEKIHKLRDRGAVLKVGLQPSFSYQEYEDWYTVQKELEECEIVYRVHFDIDDSEIDELDMCEEVPDIPYSRCVVDDDYYVWE